MERNDTTRKKSEELATTARKLASNKSGIGLIAKNPELSNHAVVREAQLPMFDGLGKTQRNEKIANGEYPAPFQISDSGRAKAWFLSEILEWQQQRRRLRDEAKPAPQQKVS
jgi:predicted DNA-binding transcriptional regulator AlpA